VAARAIMLKIAGKTRIAQTVGRGGTLRSTAVTVGSAG